MTQNPALIQLTENAKQIYQLISKQKTHLCLAKCPAFESMQMKDIKLWRIWSML